MVTAIKDGNDDYDDELLELAGYPTVADQERLSAKIIAAEESDVAQEREQIRRRLYSARARKQGATVRFDSHLGVWCGVWDDGSDDRIVPPRQRARIASRIVVNAPPPTKFTYQCARCRKVVQRTRRARNGSPVYCSAKCKQSAQRRSKSR